MQTLLKGLSPAYLRLGGTAADSAVFSDEPVPLLGHILNSKLTQKWLKVKVYSRRIIATATSQRDQILWFIPVSVVSGLRGRLPK